MFFLFVLFCLLVAMIEEPLSLPFLPPAPPLHHLDLLLSFASSSSLARAYESDQPFHLLQLCGSVKRGLR